MKALLFILCASLSAAALVKREAEAEAEPAYGYDVNGGEIYPKYNTWYAQSISFPIDQISLSLCALSPL